MSTYDFSTLYTTLPHNLIKDKLIDLIERTFQREGSPYLACSDRNAFFTSEKPKKYHAWSCQNVCDALTFLLDNIFIRFGTKLYRQVVGIPMGTNCAPLVADLFLFCYERDFMMSLSDDKQADVIDAFNTTSRYLDDILNINNVYFDNMVSQIYPSELQLNKANASDTEAAFLDLHLSISNDIVSTKIYDKRDDFDFEIVNFPFLDGDVPRSTSYGVYISQLIRFARASSYVADFNTRNKLLTQKLLKQGYRYHKLRKTFSKFYRRYYDLISKFQVGLKSLLHQGLSEPDFYGDLVYKLKKIVGSNNFSAQFIKIISHYKKIGYNINVLQRTACLVVGPVAVGGFAFLFCCAPVGRTSGSMMVPTWGLVCWWGGGGLVLWLLSGPPGFACWVSFAPVFGLVCCWVLVLALSPCYILIYMFWGMMHWWVGGLSCRPGVCVSWSASGLGMGLAPLGRFRPSSGIFY